MGRRSKLPQFQNDDMAFQQMQNQWGAILDPIVALPLNNGQILQNVELGTGANSVNHKLGRVLKGWFIVRQRAASSIYDTQDTNSTPAVTLNLVSSASAIVDIFVF